MRARRPIRLTATPLQQIATDGRDLRSTGDQPELALVSPNGILPTGWIALGLREGTADSPVIYVDGSAGSLEWRDGRRWPPWGADAGRIVHVPAPDASLRVRPIGRPGPFPWGPVTMRRLGRLDLGACLVAHVLRRARLDAPRLGRQLLRLPELWRLEGLTGVRYRVRTAVLGRPQVSRTNYRGWVRRYDTVTDDDRRAITRAIASLRWRPTIRLHLCAAGASERHLGRSVESVVAQHYPCWQLSVTVAEAAPPAIRRLIGDWARRDPRIRIAGPGGPVCESPPADPSAPARPEFVASMGAEDALPEHALFLVAAELDRRPDADILYTDEDRIDDAGGRADPLFKPDWNPDLLSSANYIGRLLVWRASLAPPAPADVGASGEDGEHAQLLRIAGQTKPDRIRHIPHVGYHRRAAPGTDGLAASLAAQRSSCPLPAPLPLVTLVIPSRDRRDLIEACVTSILTRSDYRPLEVLIVDNGSRDPEALAYLALAARDPRVRVVRDARPFNFSALVNRGVAAARGQIIGLVNSDVVVISPGWLTEMVRHAVRPEVGVVGAKLFYPDGTIQHAGIVIGIHGICGHVHRRRAREARGYAGRALAVQQLSAVTAACMVMRREVFDAVGGLDEAHLPIAFNDIDVCLRIAALGYRTVWTPWAELFHREGASRGLDYLASDRFASEIAYMKSRWGPELAADPFYNPNLTLDDEDFGLAFPPRAAKPW